VGGPHLSFTDLHSLHSNIAEAPAAEREAHPARGRVAVGAWVVPFLQPLFSVLHSRSFSAVIVHAAQKSLNYFKLSGYQLSKIQNNVQIRAIFRPQIFTAWSPPKFCRMEHEIAASPQE